MTAINTYLYVAARASMEGSFLDVGCGTGTLGFILKVWGRKGDIVGIDLYEESLKKAKQIYDHVVLCDGRFLPFRNKVFSFVSAVEVLEHISKIEGKLFLKQLESLVNGLLIITTPNGFQKHGEGSENPYQKHLSGWKSRELKNLGFKVRGLLVRSKLALLIPPFITWYFLLFADDLLGIKKVK